MEIEIECLKLFWFFLIIINIEVITKKILSLTNLTKA